MDAKITLSFDKDIIERAKKYAEAQNMSLSRMLEFILDKMTAKTYTNLEELPISDWVSMVSEGKAEYIRNPKSNKQLKSAYRSRKK